MNETTRQKLNAINRTFYETTATEFDQTRGRAWPGWEALTPYLSDELAVLDVGCGNGRFAAFLAEHCAGPISYHGLDSNDALLTYASGALATLDNVEGLLERYDFIADALPARTYDWVVLFGVIHHVPGKEERAAFITSLAECVRPGGMLCFAAWRFYEYERFRERLVPWNDYDPALVTEEHDYLLDWRLGVHALRYCHHVDDEEQQALITASGLQPVTAYRADGSDGRMNAYSVLRKSEDDR